MLTQKTLELLSCFLLKRVVAVCSSHFLELPVPAATALRHWQMNAEMPMKGALHHSYGFSLAELQTSKRLVLQGRCLENDSGHWLFVCWESC